MPWIKQNKCVGCGICVDVCSVEVIFMDNGKAVINQNKCIKCGKCLDVCSKRAIRPNSENSGLRGNQFSGLGRDGGRGQR